jgi:hypothetical protein
MSGKVSSSDFKECIGCPGGKYSSYAGTYSEGSSSFCDFCSKGTVSGKGMSSCSKCEEGNFSPFENSSICLRCSTGRWSNDGGSECAFVGVPCDLWVCLVD